MKPIEYALCFNKNNLPNFLSAIYNELTTQTN